MCGICGKLLFNESLRVDPLLIKKMLDSIRHRGPDDEGIYNDIGIGLGHRRLSIIDLKSGHQPITNENNSVWIVFNGEIYNYKELRNDLINQGHSFRTKTDTEVIIHLYEEYGENCVNKLRGMFAFALWDSNNQTLLLARDRVGIKPLYYFKSNESIVFASEIKAIMADPTIPREIEPRMIDRFFTFYFLPGEETLFKGIYKLLPGYYLLCKGNNLILKQYWDIDFTHSAINLKEAEIRTIELLEESLNYHMISDVPVGFLLSGGVDSTAMLSFAVGKTDYPLSSYTLGFSEDVEADERPFAKLAAKKYSSQHHEMTINSKQFADFMSKYVWHMEEPVCEPQAVALYYVSKMASQFVKVLISGEGGDEAFAGYSIYRNLLWLERIKNIFGPMNSIIEYSLKYANTKIKSKKIDKYAPLLNIPFSSYYFSRTSSPLRYFNHEFTKIYTRDFLNFVDKDNSTKIVLNFLNSKNQNNYVSRMLYVDTKTSLPDDLLLKADKMTMANSLELRVPFLDHKLLEFAASLPPNFKVRGFCTKYLAKRALKHRLPKEILQRRKVGFPVPYDKWLRTEMDDWVHSILFDRKTIERGYFNQTSIKKIIDINKSTKGNLSKEVLSLVTLELLHRAFI